MDKASVTSGYFNTDVHLCSLDFWFCWLEFELIADPFWISLCSFCSAFPLVIEVHVPIVNGHISDSVRGVDSSCVPAHFTCLTEL